MTRLAVAQQEQLLEQVQHYDLEPIAAKLKEVAQPAIFIVTPEADDYTVRGVSRIGGVPDLPPEIPWPKTERGFLSFVAQINLAELPQLGNNPLPKQGILYFFFGGVTGPGIFNRVLFYEGDLQALKTAVQPDMDQFHDPAEYATYDPCRVKMNTGITLPGYDASEDWQALVTLMQSGLGDSWYDRYFELQNTLTGLSVREKSQILGLPSIIPGDDTPGCYAQWEREGKWAFGTAELPPEKPDQATIDQWHLLLELDSHEKARMLWCDAGQLQFMIHADDLQLRDFSRTFCTLITT